MLIVLSGCETKTSNNSSPSAAAAADLHERAEQLCGIHACRLFSQVLQAPPLAWHDATPRTPRSLPGPPAASASRSISLFLHKSGVGAWQFPPQPSAGICVRAFAHGSLPSARKDALGRASQRSFDGRHFKQRRKSAAARPGEPPGGVVSRGGSARRRGIGGLFDVWQWKRWLPACSSGPWP